MSRQAGAGALTRAVEAMAVEFYYDDEVGRLATIGPWKPIVLAALQAADDHLREHYWAEFRERLLAIAKKCSAQAAAEEHAGRSRSPALRHAEAAAIREAISAALATTQHKGAPQ